MATLLKQILKEKGISVAEFERRMGVTRNSLIDGTKRQPSIKMLQAYADALDVPVWSLLYDCGVPAVANPTDTLSKCPYCGCKLELVVELKSKDND